jgi:hypothetical protein
MQNEAMQYYLLSPYEAELIACFRMLSEPAQEVISSLAGSQSVPSVRDLVTPAKLSLVSKF